MAKKTTAPPMPEPLAPEPEPSSPSDALAAALTAGNVLDVARAVESIDDAGALERLSRAEAAGKRRKGVLDALEARLGAIRGPEASGAGLFKVVRVKGVAAVVGVTVNTSPRTTVRRFPVDEDAFQVDRPTAQAMERTGGFRIAADSKAKPKARR